MSRVPKWKNSEQKITQKMRASDKQTKKGFNKCDNVVIGVK